jgi:hypothetical protein
MVGRPVDESAALDASPARQLLATGVGQVDQDRLGAFALHVWSYKQGEVVSPMPHLGDRLGLYRDDGRRRRDERR